MSLRSTFIALAVIIALCGGGLYLLNNAFSREAQIRDAELGFAANHGNEIAAANARLNTRQDSGYYEEAETAPAYEGEEPLSLDSWYADAGSSSGPADTTPEDKDYLVNDTEPYSDAEPIDW
ncbi:MAG: hypothetical protein ACM308_07280 [Qipengyuania vulgaris]